MNNFGIILYMPKNDFNIGHVLRSAHCFGANFITIIGKRYSYAATDTYNTTNEIPLFTVSEFHKNIIPHNYEPIVVEITPESESIIQFKHPKQCVYIFGPEDGSIPIEISQKYKNIHIPTNGCMNLGMCAHVTLYDRMYKNIIPFI
jgi:tRNA(Leu) C34 or U34 (ribose-2'-O)-methylase TrmL